MPGYKQSIVLRKDLGLSEGKKIAQACHASLGSVKKADDDAVRSWEEAGAKKVALLADNEQKLVRLFEEAKRSGLPAYLVQDAGRTELDPGTTTCLGIGPGPEDALDAITGQLELV